MYLLEDKFFDTELDCFEQTYDLEELLESDEEWIVKLEICELEHIVQFDGNSISEYIDDERLTEDNDVNDRKRIAEDDRALYGSKETGAVKRAAMDLKNELTKITR